MSDIDLSKTVLVTGGTGFAGSHLIELLVESGYTNVHTTVFRDPPKELAKVLPEDHFHQADLTDQDATLALFEQVQPDHIYHLAAFAAVGSSFTAAQRVLQNNSALQLCVLESMRQHSPKARLLNVGSADVYGLSEPGEVPITEDHPLRPINPYAVSKATQDLLAFVYTKSYQLDIVRVRPFNHIGERQSPDFAIPSFAQQVVQCERDGTGILRVGNLDAVRDFSDVKDVVSAYKQVMEFGAAGEVYNIGSGTGWVMRDMLEQLIALSTTTITVEQDPERMRPHDIPKMVANNDKITALGWKPGHTIQDTLKRTLNWYRAQE